MLMPPRDCEWSIVAYMKLAPNRPKWQNRFGEDMTYGALLEHLMQLDLSRRPCGWVHVLRAIHEMTIADKTHSFLTTGQRRSANKFLLNASRQLIRSQTDEGAWTAEWHATMPSTSTRTSLEEAISVTAHHVEWMLIADDRCLPPQQTIDYAIGFLCRTLPSFCRSDIEYDDASYCAASHGCRVVTMLAVRQDERVHRLRQTDVR